MELAVGTAAEPLKEEVSVDSPAGSSAVQTEVFTWETAVPTPKTGVAVTHVKTSLVIHSELLKFREESLSLLSTPAPPLCRKSISIMFKDSNFQLK